MPNHQGNAPCIFLILRKIAFMKYIYTSLLMILGLTLTQAQTLDPIWLKQIASSQNGGGGLPDESVDILKADGEGNIYVVGKIQANGQIDSINIWNINGSEAAYLAKFSCEGELLWYKLIGNSNGVDEPNSMILSKDGSSVSFSLPFSASPTNPLFIDMDTTLSPPNPGDGGELLIQYDSAGTLTFFWGSGYQQVNGVFPNITLFKYSTSSGFTYDHHGNLYGIAYASDTGTVGPFTISQKGKYLTKIGIDGKIKKSVFISEEQSGFNEKVVFLDDNSIIYKVDFNPPFIFGTDTFTTGQYLLAKLDTNGNVLWAKSTGLSVADIEVSKNGNILVGGGGLATRDFFGIPMSVTGGFAGEVDAQTGTANWLTECKTIGVGVGANTIHQSESGKIYWGGGLIGAAVFGNDTISSRSNEDMWLSELDSTGNYQWVDFIVGRPSGSIERMRSICTDPGDNIYFGGYFEGRLEYPSDTVFKRGGVSDGFFAKLGSPGCFVCPTTVAQFSSTDSFLRVSFDASASLEADSFFWDFDDGSTDTGVSPSHVYSIDGSYNICLIAKSDCDADTVCQMISVADSMVGISELNSLEVYVFPNPSLDGVFTVRTEQGAPGAYELFDLTGRLLGRGELDSDGSTSFELDDYAGSAVLRLMFDPPHRRQGYGGHVGTVVRVVQFLP
jgi:PKD repeat protein